MNKLLSSILSLTLALLLNNCAGRTTGNSFVHTSIQDSQVIEKIAADATFCMAVLYPPGKTSLHLQPPTNNNNFSASLESQLRSKGFALVQAQSTTPTTPTTIRVSYVLDTLKTDSSLLLRLVFIDANGAERKIMRSYDLTGQPESGFSTVVGIDAQSQRLGDVNSSEFENKKTKSVEEESGKSRHRSAKQNKKRRIKQVKATAVKEVEPQEMTTSPVPPLPVPQPEPTPPTKAK